MFLAATQTKMLPWQEPPHCTEEWPWRWISKLPALPLSFFFLSCFFSLLSLTIFPCFHSLAYAPFPQDWTDSSGIENFFLIEKEHPFSFKWRSSAACFTFKDRGSSLVPSCLRTEAKIRLNASSSVLRKNLLTVFFFFLRSFSSHHFSKILTKLIMRVWVSCSVFYAVTLTSRSVSLNLGVIYWLLDIGNVAMVIL